MNDSDNQLSVVKSLNDLFRDPTIKEIKLDWRTEKIGDCNGDMLILIPVIEVKR